MENVIWEEIKGYEGMYVERLGLMVSTMVINSKRRWSHELLCTI